MNVIMDYSILVFLLLVARGTWAGQNFTVGYLMSDMSSQYVQGKQGRVISGAMTYAISQINADPHLLAGHSLRFMTADTEASTLVGTSRVIEQWRAGAIAFFGPEDSCDTEARVAAALNLPMISYVSPVQISSLIIHPSPLFNKFCFTQQLICYIIFVTIQRTLGHEAK